jgi:catechol 2,3-dioxygenase-like lactoylglutathione lyase family enzyme
MQKETNQAVAIGINHVALEVGDIEEALTFYRELFTFELRGRNENMAFIDLGDQFLNLSQGRHQEPDRKRHFGLVVDDREAVRRSVKRLGCRIVASPSPAGLDFLDPWGNHIQIVEYAAIQFTKSPDVLKGMGLGALEKSLAAREELRAKGMGPAAG